MLIHLLSSLTFLIFVLSNFQCPVGAAVLDAENHENKNGTPGSAVDKIASQSCLDATVLLWPRRGVSTAESIVGDDENNNEGPHTLHINPDGIDDAFSIVKGRKLPANLDGKTSQDDADTLMPEITDVDTARNKLYENFGKAWPEDAHASGEDEGEKGGTHA